MSRSLVSRPYGALWVCALLLAACGDRPPVVQEADTGPLIPDSASVRVMSDSVPAWGDTQPWTISARPTLELGTPGQTFVGVAPVLQLSDGRIVIADGSRQAVRYFGPDGELLPSAGGSGATDGQFHGLGWIGRAAGDTVVAYDFVVRRLTVFDSEGRMVHTVPLLSAEPDAPAVPLGTFTDGSILFRIGGPASPFAGQPGAILRDSASYMRFTLDGTPVASLGRFPQGESFGVQVRPNQPPQPFPVAYGLSTVAALRADTMLVGTAAEFAIAEIAPDGTPVGLLRAPIARAKVTSAESKAYTRKALERLESAVNAKLDTALVRSLRQAPFPERKPAYGRFLVDATGALWVSGPLSPPDPPTEWTVFSPEGAWLGTMTTPDQFRVDEIGTDYLLGVLRSADGQERIQRYALSRGAGN